MSGPDRCASCGVACEDDDPSWRILCAKCVTQPDCDTCQHKHRPPPKCPECGSGKIMVWAGSLVEWQCECESCGALQKFQPSIDAALDLWRPK